MRIIAALTVESVFNRDAGIGGWAELASPVTVDSPHRSTVLVAAAYGAFHRLDNAAALEHIVRADARPSQPLQFAMAESLRANVTPYLGGDVAESVRIMRAAFNALPGDDDTTLAAHLMLCPAPIYIVLTGDYDEARDRPISS